MEAVLVAIFGVVGVVSGALITAYFARRKTQTEADKCAAEADKTAADANDQIRETVMQLIQPLKERIADLEKEVRKLKEEKADLKTWAEALVNQIKSLGQEPVPFPRKDRDA